MRSAAYLVGISIMLFLASLTMMLAFGLEAEQGRALNNSLFFLWLSVVLTFFWLHHLLEDD